MHTGGCHASRPPRAELPLLRHVPAGRGTGNLPTYTRGVSAAPAVHLIDERALFQDALRSLLEAEGIRVAGQSTRPERAPAEVAEGVEAIITEVEFRDADGPGLVRRLRVDHPRTPVIAYTGADDPELALEVIRAGAAGYVLKDDDVELLARAARIVRGGDAFLSPPIARLVVDAVARGSIAAAPAGDHRVSGRELEVLELLTRGLDNQRIASELGISPRTVKNHVAHILAKLGFDNRVQAAVWAVRHGIG